MTTLLPANFAPMIIGLALIVLVGAIVLTAIQKYDADSVLKILGALGTLIGFIVGGMGTYFFTREQVQRQEYQTKMYQAAFQASEKEKAEAGEQFLKVAAKIKPDVTSPQNQQLLERYEFLAKELTKIGKIPVSKHPEMYFDINPSPSPSQSP